MTLTAFDPQIATYTLIGLGVFVVILIIWIIRLEIKFKRLLVGKDAYSIEDSLKELTKRLGVFDQFRKEVEDYLKTVEHRLKKSIQAIETVRFNPFKGGGVGGNQSFASAFLNERGDGVILSSIYGHERVSIFSKPIKNFTSEYELSDEEKEALAKAVENTKFTVKK